MLIAISAGVIAPMSSPMGAWMRSRHAAGMPSASERIVDADHLGAASYQSEVAEIARGQRADRIEVVLMPAGQHGDVLGRGNPPLCEPVGNRLDHDLRAGKAPGVGELLAIVDDVDAEPGFCRGPREMQSHVARRR